MGIWEMVPRESKEGKLINTGVVRGVGFFVYNERLPLHLVRSSNILAFLDESSFSTHQYLPT